MNDYYESNVIDLSSSNEFYSDLLKICQNDSQIVVICKGKEMATITIMRV